MFKTIVHHTLRDDENPEYIEANAPFPVQALKNAYLGGGYYFWDDHIELAHWWGQTHCQDSYIICQGDFEISNMDFCDLLGSRQDQIYFQECINRLKVNHLPIGAIVELLKGLNTHPAQRGIFPYKAIRAVDMQANTTFSQTFYKYAGNRPGITTFNPKVIICLIKKDAAILRNFKITHPHKYVA